MRRLELRASAISEVGLCKQENQDRVLALIGEGGHGDFGLFMIADGMGGQRGGSQAAEIAVREYEAWWDTDLPGFIGERDERLHALAIRSLTETAYRVNESVMELGGRLKAFPGTTVSVLFVYGTGYSFAHLGDSRIYKMDGQLEQLTTDDTWIAQQIRRGKMTAAEAINHPNRHILTQCAGSGKNVQVHSGQGVLSSKSVFMICSDGYYNHLSNGEIVSLVSDRHNMDRGLRDSVKTIYVRGAADNLSSIIVAIGHIKEGTKDAAFPF